MKSFLCPITILLCVGLSSCVPGKFASGIEGVIVDRESSKPVQGAILESSIPHKDGDKVTASTTTDKEGRFTFLPEYGIYQLLMMSADSRNVVIYKDGYKQLHVSISHRDEVRRIITLDDRRQLIESPRKEELILSLQKK